MLQSLQHKIEMELSHDKKQFSSVRLCASNVHTFISQSQRTLKTLAAQYQMQKRFNLQICEDLKLQTLC